MAYRYTLALCSVFQNEAAYLREWIEFYLLIGVQRFYLHNNHSTDNFHAVLEPYVQREVVRVIDWPHMPTDVTLRGAFSNGIACARADQVQWLICVDTDEFLFSPQQPDLRTLLARFDDKRIGAVCANWMMFGTADVPHVPSDRLMIELLTQRAPILHSENRHVKSIVRPDRCVGMTTQHHPALLAGYEQTLASGERFCGPWAPRIDVSMLRVHHYYTRDKSWLPHKIARRIRYGAPIPPTVLPVYNAVLDCTAARVLARALRVQMRLDTPQSDSQQPPDRDMLLSMCTPMSAAEVLESAERADDRTARLDPTWYLDAYPDLRAAGIVSLEQARQHWYAHGQYEHRKPCADMQSSMNI